MTKIINQKKIDNLPIIFIPVIASFNEDGQINPLYVGIDGKRYKVESYWVRRSFSNQIEFSCKLLCGETLLTIIITYYMNECIWTVPTNK